MLIQFPPLYAEDDGTPQGGDAKVRASDVLEQFGKDAVRLAEKLADVQSDNYRLREERRGLKKELEDAKGKVPASDARVLTKEEADEYAAYAALGKPDALKTALDTKGTAEQELTTLKREKQIAKAAEAAGFKASVLTTLAGDLDIQTEQKDGKPLVYIVKDGEKTALADYAAKEWADFMPALAAQTVITAPDINAGARGGGNTPLLTDEDRKAAQRRYSATF